MGKKRLRQLGVKKNEDLEDIDVARSVLKMKKKASAADVDESQDEQRSKKKKSSKKGLISTHKDELASLRESDPDFFKFLQQNDTNLLEFGMGEDDEDEDEFDGRKEHDIAEEDEGDEDDAEEDEEEEDYRRGKKRGVGKKSGDMVEVTPELLADISKKCLSTPSGSISSVKKLLSMFRAACIPSGSDGGEDSRGLEEGPSSRYVIGTPEIYEQVMVTCIETASPALFKVLGCSLDELTVETLEGIGKHPKWKAVQMQVLSFFRSILHTLAGIAEGGGASRQGQVCVFLLRSLEEYIPFVSPLPRLAKGVLKVLLNLWSEGPNPSQDASNVRGHAFLRIRQMALVLPAHIAEEVFRSIYLSYARCSKSFSELTASEVLFMSQCITELFSLDTAQAYQQAFLYIRQLALHLRTATIKKTSESLRQVTSWQFVNCLRLWNRVVCAMPSPTDGLGALAFPLAQIILGVMAAEPPIPHLPLRFHLITCLQQLAANTRCFIPTAAKLVDILEHPDLSSKPTPSTEKPPRLQYLVRFPADSITKASVRDVVVQETLALLRHELEIYRFHVGLPEYAYLTSRKLRVFMKKTKIAKWRDMARTLVGQYEQYAGVVKRLRTKLGTAPKDIQGFEPLLPPGTPSAAERLAKLVSSKGSMNSLSSVTLAKPNEGIGGNKLKKGSMVSALKDSKDSKKKSKNSKYHEDDEDESDDDDESDENEDKDEDNDDDDDDDGDDDDDEDEDLEEGEDEDSGGGESEEGDPNAEDIVKEGFADFMSDDED